jgi:DnaJ-class molecular chaperone
MKQLTYVEALANLLKFVSKIGQDPKQSEATQQEAAEVAADFLVAALLQTRKAPEETAPRCTRCHGDGKVKLMYDNENKRYEYDTCPKCGGAGRGIV